MDSSASREGSRERMGRRASLSMVLDVQHGYEPVKGILVSGWFLPRVGSISQVKSIT